MENPVLIASILGPVWIILGISLLGYTPSWRKLMETWRKDHYTLFPLALMTMVLGLIIIRMYNVWEWNTWIIVTLAGWAAFLKGTVYMLAPGSWTKTLLNLKNNVSLLYLAGFISIVLGGFLCYSVYYLS
ncbi:MAG: hypothetical protein UT55_C0048G0006 [Candidatus Peregrinibacteria bacterium GW2011_GWE2_39_6]|nr:MAG: hypothetical protein UT36_C0004G0096 [Candidatus Peregrinibacteria bacterium GW2011_GWF2_39_17]KKR25175.1 MAG: hypothetical protein UT55_C0048G0006 [Candidatus Peregrinibacteria bacterium GW2011_GWE2_39_6]HCW32215.1 hypothetical protein [Candidatus Peregrinibacteria bacterium]